MALVALKHFSGAYHMLICHVGPPYGTPGAPKRAHFGPERPFWGPRRSLGSPGGPNLVPSATGWSNWVGRIHIMCSGPLRDHYGTPGAPKRAHFGPERPFWGPRTAPGARIGPDCHWSVQLGGLYPYHVLGPLKRPLWHSWDPPKGPFWPKRALLRALDVLRQPRGA